MENACASSVATHFSPTLSMREATHIKRDALTSKIEILILNVLKASLYVCAQRLLVFSIACVDGRWRWRFDVDVLIWTYHASGVLVLKTTVLLVTLWGAPGVKNTVKIPDKKTGNKKGVLRFTGFGRRYAELSVEYPLPQARNPSTWTGFPVSY